MGTRTSYAPGTFSWVDLATTDPGGAKEFYSAMFSWSTEDSPVPGGTTYTMCNLDGADVAGIGPLQQEQADAGIPPHWNSYVTVASADETAARAKDLGAAVLAEPFDVMESGRMAAIADPTGAPFCVWEPFEHIGAGLVNEPGALTWNELATRDVDAAIRFYEQLFGWTVEEIDTQGGPRYWTIGHQPAAAGRNGGMRELAPEQEGIPAHWLPYFVVSSAEEAGGKARANGGDMPFGPLTLPTGATIAVLTDPQGGHFAIFEGETDG